MITGNVLPALIAYVHSTSLITGYNTFNMNITQWAYSQGSGESWGVMPRVSQVAFSAWGHSGVKPRSHTNTQQRREQRDVCFLAGNTVNILSLCQLNMRILRFIVHSVLAVLFKGVISNQITFSRYVSIRDNKTCQHSYKQMSLTDKNTIIHEKYIQYLCLLEQNFDEVFAANTCVFGQLPLFRYVSWHKSPLWVFLFALEFSGSIDQACLLAC